MVKIHGHSHLSRKIEQAATAAAANHRLLPKHTVKITHLEILMAVGMLYCGS